MVVVHLALLDSTETEKEDKDEMVEMIDGSRKA